MCVHCANEQISTGSTGFLKTVNASIPGHLNTGEVIAMVGAGLMFMKGGTN